MLTLSQHDAAPLRRVEHGLDAAAGLLSRARELIALQARTLASLGQQLDQGFVDALTLMAACRGRIVVCGVGKTGLIGQKISATLASTGTPSHFMHAAEASHGDLGRLASDDLVLVLSYSGGSAEVLRLLGPLRARQLPLVALVGRSESRLARAADAVIATGEVAEACSLGMAPTTSTTAMLVLGDALAVCLAEARGLDREAYARCHPGGSLGRQLMRVGVLMRTGAACPQVTAQATLAETLACMTTTPGRPGAALVVGPGARLLGLFTDGDLRRLLNRPDFSVQVPIHTVMQARPTTIDAAALVRDAERLLRQHQVDQLPVVDAAGMVLGLLDVQDILAERLG